MSLTPEPRAREMGSNAHRFCVGHAVRRAAARVGFANLIEVNFGAAPPDRNQANIWNLAKESLPHGAIPADDEKLGSDLGSPGAHIRTNGQLVLESKPE